MVRKQWRSGSERFGSADLGLKELELESGG